MKKELKVIIYVLLFIFILILSVYGYNILKNNYNEVNKEITEKSAESNIIKNNTTNALKKAIDFNILDNDNNKVKLSDFLGSKPIVVNFWATWCPPCRNELPDFNEYYKLYKDDIEFLMVNLTDGINEKMDNVKKFVKENNYEFPVYFDVENSASNVYNIYSIPQTLFIDKEGNIVKNQIGMLNKSTLETNIKKIHE